MEEGYPDQCAGVTVNGAASTQKIEILEVAGDDQIGIGVQTAVTDNSHLTYLLALFVGIQNSPEFVAGFGRFEIAIALVQMLARRVLRHRCRTVR